MGLFSKKRQMHERRAKLPHSDLAPQPAASSSSQSEPTIVYTGGALCVTLQRAKSRLLQEEGPTRLVWSKDQRLGLTFVQLPQGGVAVKDMPGMRGDVSSGQELIGVGKVSVIGMSLQAVEQRLRAAPSPCVLVFAPPPSPIVVSEVLPPASRRGVQRGMVLKSVNGRSMIGAKLSDVGVVIRGASESSPVRLTFAPYDAVVRPSFQLPIQADDPKKSRSTLRNTLCIGAIAALISF